MVAGSRDKRAALAAAMRRGGVHAKSKPIKWKPPKYTISDAFRIFCKRTSGHGWYRIHRAKTLKGTCFWFFLTLIAFTFSVIYTINMWSNFVRYTTETSIHTTVGKNTFPAVTICSHNPIKQSIVKNNSYPIPSEYRQALLDGEGHINRTLQELIYKQSKLQGKELDIHYEAYRNLIFARSGTTAADRKLLGYSKDDLIGYCRFGQVSCSEAHWQYVQDDAYGNCYTYKNEAKINAGVVHGLHLILKMDPTDYLSWYAEAVGTKVAIHEAASKPQMISNAFSIPPGKAAEFGIRMESWTRLGEPYYESGCGDYGNYSKVFGWKYSAQGCRETCRQRNIISRCGCSDWREPQASGTPTCLDSKKEVIACIHEANTVFDKDPGGHCRCPPACEEKIWRAQTSFSNWPAPDFDESEYIRDFGIEPANTGSLKIFYRTPSVTHYADIPTESEYQFLGWLGGQLAVWTGASLITVLEVIGFFLTALLVLCTENVDWLMADEEYAKEEKRRKEEEGDSDDGDDDDAHHDDSKTPLEDHLEDTMGERNHGTILEEEDLGDSLDNDHPVFSDTATTPVEPMPPTEFYNP